MVNHQWLSETSTHLLGQGGKCGKCGKLSIRTVCIHIHDLWNVGASSAWCEAKDKVMVFPRGSDDYCRSSDVDGVYRLISARNADI